MYEYAYLIPVFPLVAFAINILFGRYLKEAAGLVSVISSILACIVGLPAAYAVIQEGHHIVHTWPWLSLGAFELEMGYLLDPLSATLLFVVTVIGTLIQIYAIGYMHGDKHFSRFFAYVSLFMAGMLALVIAPNYVQFFMAWEIMGLCSYLLIGFYFSKDSAANASRKAFLTTRVGDVGFFLGIMTLFVATGTLNFIELDKFAHHAQGSALLTIAAIFIFCGTIGKSAQFPLHVWLPDAMEGPTPVSALIHAATMVAAGVYLVARTFNIIGLDPNVGQVIAMIGTITAFMAAFIALTQNDIKKVLAYSTISQLGFMVACMGLGGMEAGTFHLMTHAFFKALLFMGAGSVIHGTHTQDMRQMGGLFKKMPHTAWTMLIASLAIAGVFPLSGFWSKDEILLTALKSHNYVIFWTLAISAFMTSFYMFRLIFMTFFGEPRDRSITPHESPAVMTLPLWALAIGSIFVGIPGSPFMHYWLQDFLHGAHGKVEHHVNWFVVSVSIFVALGGIALAYFFYMVKKDIPEKIALSLKPLYRASLDKLWFDETYAHFIVRPWHEFAAFLFEFDKKVVDAFVNGTGHFTMFKSRITGWIDKYIVDGLVNFVGHFTQFVGAIYRRLQSGFVQHYLLIVFAGLIAIVIYELKSF